MNRNLQMKLKRHGVSYSDGHVTTVSQVAGKLVHSTKSASEHFSQYDPAAFSLQSIVENGLDSDLRSSSPLEFSSLDVLDSFNAGIRTSPIFESKSSSDNGTSESQTTQTDN